MLASELLGSKWLDEHEDIDITGIAYDSRNVLPGNIFVCIKGFETDGHKYAEMAVKNGASLIVAEDKIDVDVPVWYVENSRVEIAEMACKYYGNPSSKFKLIGITGTNGKTTITYLIKSIIETAGMRIGVIKILSATRYLLRKVQHLQHRTHLNFNSYLRKWLTVMRNVL